MSTFQILAQAEATSAPAHDSTTITTAPGGAAPSTQTVAPPWWANQFIPLLLIAVVFYLVVFRSKRTQDKKRTEMLQNLKRGDRVQTIGENPRHGRRGPRNRCPAQGG